MDDGPETSKLRSSRKVSDTGFFHNVLKGFVGVSHVEVEGLLDRRSG